MELKNWTIVKNKDIDIKKTELKSKKSGLVFIYAMWCGHCRNFKDSANELRLVLPKEFELFAMNEETIDPKILEKIGVTSFPFLALVKKGKITTKYTGDRTMESMLTFICDEGSYCKRN